MTITLYRKGKQKKVKGLMVDRIDCTPDRVEHLTGLGWSASPFEAHHPKPLPLPEPLPEPVSMPESEPVYEYKVKKKKGKKK